MYDMIKEEYNAFLRGFIHGMQNSQGGKDPYDDMMHKLWSYALGITYSFNIKHNIKTGVPVWDLLPIKEFESKYRVAHPEVKA